MSTDMEKDVFATYSYGKIALQKIGSTSPDFRLYSASIVGDFEPQKSSEMTVTGAIFRRPNSGPFKGTLCIQVPCTQRTVRVTREDIKTFESNNPADDT